MPVRSLRRWCLVAAVLSFQSTVAWSASVAPVVSDRGMVVTAQHLATEVGADVLRRGGNAVDAAVAVGYALAVVYPAAGNLGGGGFMTLHLADGRETFIDFREKAPLAATADMYLGADGNVVKGRSTVGHLAVGVPGTVAGLELARTKFGTMPRQALVAPAIRLAERGFVLDEGDARMFEVVGDALEADAATAAIFLKNGRAPRAGERLVQKDLAATLKRIAARGHDGFYRGRTAEALVASSQMGGGVVRHADLAAYQAVGQAVIDPVPHQVAAPRVQGLRQG